MTSTGDNETDKTEHRGSAIWIVAAISAIVLAGVVLMCWPSVIGPFGQGERALTDARVSVTASCDSADPRDEVVYGRDQRVKVSSCGERVGEQVRVTLPDGKDTNAQVAETSSGTAGAYRPVGFVLVTLAGLAGAGYVMLLGPKRLRSAG